MPVRGKETIQGFVPQANYTVLVHEAEAKVTGGGNPAVVCKVEILGPATVEHAGKTYKTAGASGIMYIMLKNKNGEDAAIEQLVPTLEKLKLLDSIPQDATYGRAELEPILEGLALKQLRMKVTSQAEYDTDSTDPKAKYNEKEARRDANGEPVVVRWNTRFDFNNVLGYAETGEVPF
jgi:hypothetical protein